MSLPLGNNYNINCLIYNTNLLSIMNKFVTNQKLVSCGKFLIIHVAISVISGITLEK